MMHGPINLNISFWYSYSEIEKIVLAWWFASVEELGSGFTL